MRRKKEYTAVFSLGGVLYSFMEIIARGHTHWTMTLTGGACFLALYKLHTDTKTRISLPRRCLIGGGIITGAELLVGLLVNRVLGWDVWDYSERFGNVCGQICLPFTALWCLLSLAAAPMSYALCRQLRKN